MTTQHSTMTGDILTPKDHATLTRWGTERGLEVRFETDHEMFAEMGEVYRRETRDTFYSALRGESRLILLAYRDAQTGEAVADAVDGPGSCRGADMATALRGWEEGSPPW